MLRRLAAAVAATGFVFVAGACESPTLPLPPPAVPEVQASAIAGHKHLVSKNGTEPNAIVVIINPSLPIDQRIFGAQADNNGSWDADVVATKGDVLQITAEWGTTRSAPIEVQIQQ
jgi:hypothetical protein